MYICIYIYTFKDLIPNVSLHDLFQISLMFWSNDWESEKLSVPRMELYRKKGKHRKATAAPSLKVPCHGSTGGRAFANAWRPSVSWSNDGINHQTWEWNIGNIMIYIYIYKYVIYISNNMVHGCIWGILNPLCFRVLYTPVTNGIILEAVIVSRLIHLILDV